LTGRKKDLRYFRQGTHRELSRLIPPAGTTIWIEKFSRGEFRFAELLLNAGCSWNTVREYSLEGDAGYRGVAPMSAELRIFLPGSHAWGWEGDEIPIPDIGS
jgi:hypothetical protein